MTSLIFRYEKSLWDCNNTLATELTPFNITYHETVQVSCQEALKHCLPFSVMITEQSPAEPNPRLIAPWIHPSGQGYEYIGCFQVGEEMHIQKWFGYNDQMVPNKCWELCAREMINHQGPPVIYDVFAIRKGAYCGCGGTEYGKYGLVEEDLCDVGCIGDIGLMQCGGTGFYSAFEMEWFDPMLLEHEGESPVVTVGNKTVEGRSEGGQELANRGRDDFEFYYSQWPNLQMNANQQELVLPTQRGFVVDPAATYKIWYGENLRRVHFDDNIGESCMTLTVGLHSHPKSWLDSEKNELVDDGSSSIDYNSLFL